MIFEYFDTAHELLQDNQYHVHPGMQWLYFPN